MRHIIRAAVAAMAAVILTATAAGAAVTFDPATGTGFVGKGDVQLAFGWNNKALQDNAAGVSFEFVEESETVTETSWECTNDRNENVQERERTTTTNSTTTGVVSKIARDNKKQITGFILDGFNSSDSQETSETDGPPLNSCPSGPWSLTTPAGDPEVISETSTSELFVKHGGTSHSLGVF